MNRIQLKNEAKQIMLEPRRPNVFLMTILYTLIIMILAQIIGRLSDWGRYSTEWYTAGLEMLDTISQGGAVNWEMPALQITAAGLLFYVAGNGIWWMMDLGYTYYARSVVRGEEAGIRSLFEGFNYFFKGIALRLLYSVVIAAGLILLVVPGVIAVCAYSQVFLLLLDNPDKGILWMFRESRRLMRGRKLDYLVLRFSFIGWELLRQIPWIGYLAYIWAVPYIEITTVKYYEVLIGRDSGRPRQGWERPGMY